MPRKMRVVAVGAAVAAMVFTLVAVIVVLTRDGEPANAPAPSSLRDHVVKATDVVRLRDEVEVVIEAGATKGLRVKDAALAQTLGLEAGDIITSLSGKQTIENRDASDMIHRLGMMSVTTLYVDVSRGGKPVLVRWKLDGDLRQARSALISSTVASLGSAYSPSLSAVPDAAPDPLLATIEKVDDTHYKLPRSTVDAILANPMMIAKGARVVPTVKGGQSEGFKLYAIRPTSVYGMLGFKNGDTLHSVNGFELDTPDKALEVYTKLRDAGELTFDLTRRGQPVTLTIQITK